MATTTPTPLKLVVPGHSLAYCDGGIPAYALRLLETFSRIPNLTVDVLLIGDAPPPFSAPNLRYHRFPESTVSGRPLLRQLVTIASLGLHARKVFPDSILFSASDFWSPRRHPKSVVVTHDMLPELDPVYAGSVPRRVTRKLSLRYATRATRWLTISEYAAEEIASLHPGRRAEPMDLWLPSAYAVPASRQSLEELRRRLNLPASFLLYVGGYRGYKNLDLLLRAHAKACELRPGTSPLMLVGQIPPLESFPGLGAAAKAYFLRAPAEGRLLLPGRIADADLPLLYSAARLCVSASLHEGFGFPPVEAMHRGCQVLVADRTAFKYVVPKTECRFDPDNFDELVAKLLQADAEPASFLCPPNPAHSFESGVARLGAFLRTLA